MENKFILRYYSDLLGSHVRKTFSTKDSAKSEALRLSGKGVKDISIISEVYEESFLCN